MPAINVARTDTFEQQRQKINQIGTQIFDITQGGSDLATGNLKLGDGTKDVPSLSFISDTELGVFKESNSVLTFVSSGSKVFNYTKGLLASFSDFSLFKRSLSPSGILITDTGFNYDAGSYTDIDLYGGSGFGAKANITVTEYVGSITNSGQDYIVGGYTGVPLNGGSGSGAFAAIFVDSISGDITNGGSGYPADSSFVGVSLTGGSGTGATCSVVTDTNGEITFVSIASSGYGYRNGDVLSVDNTGTGGTGTGLQYTITSYPGEIVNILFSQKGTGYQAGDILTLPGRVANVSSTLDTQQYDIVVPSVSGILVDSTVVKVSGTGELDAGTTVSQIDEATNTVTLSSLPLVSGSIVLNFIPPYGEPVSNFSYEISKIGSIDTFSVTDYGIGYDVNDVITVSSADLTQPITYTITVSDPGSGDRFFIDSGSGPVETPSLTLYSGNTYVFNYSDGSNAGHEFALSQFPDGIWSPSIVSSVSATISISSNQITLSSTQGILPGMSITVDAGSLGNLQQDTKVVSVDDATTITVDKTPIVSGAATLSFSGYEYVDGVVRDNQNLTLTLKVTDSTPSLYYYCRMHGDMGGSDGNEATLTIDLNNPKTFGSDFEFLVTDITSDEIISSKISSGQFTATSVNSTSASITNLTSQSVSSSSVTASTAVQTPVISSTGSLTISPSSVSFSGDVSFGSTVQVVNSSGNITTSGVLKTTSSLNINDNITIAGSVIETVANSNLVLRPYSGKLAKIDTSTALVVPVGTTAQRPTAGVVESGSIRFNTQTGQYEGYSAATTSWSSLGGVRDIDGNTYILAELTTGANDNTLWFYNDNVNTLKLTPQFLDFRSVKKISSGRLGLPTFTLWSANTPVTIGDYVKYRNNLYEVTASGTTASSGNEPTHTSGVANNGTAQLTWYSSSVSPLEFTEIEELKVGPNKDCPLIVSSELKLFNNVISTLVEDLVLTPNAGKKVSISAPTSLVIPVGNTNQRGSASQGSIRFNTTISQFEGYSGTNWSSLGGVRDVDGNTYIIPETAPAANENILYFYNDGTNTLQLTTTELDFTNLDTITTSGGNSLALNTEIITLDNSATTIDNTDSTSTFISTTKQYLDLGLSAGLTVDPVLRLDDQGDVYLNTGFGTGTFSGVKIFDGDLKDFELADYAVKTNVLSLIKGTSNSGAVILYDTTTAKGCRVTVVSKSSAGKKSMVEYSIIDNGTDIFHNEFGSLNTSLDGFTAAFDITPGNETRITLTLSNDHAINDTVEITVLTQVVK